MILFWVKKYTLFYQIWSVSLIFLRIFDQGLNIWILLGYIHIILYDSTKLKISPKKSWKNPIFGLFFTFLDQNQDFPTKIPRSKIFISEIHSFPTYSAYGESKYDILSDCDSFEYWRYTQKSVKKGDFLSYLSYSHSREANSIEIELRAITFITLIYPFTWSQKYPPPPRV